jgi:Fur family ferric uptake transcriptional regulator
MSHQDTAGKPGATMAETGPVEIAEGELRRLGERVTAARRAVIVVLGSTGEHLSATQVAERAQAHGAELHLASVYRAVDTLTRLGLVIHTHLPGGSTTYHLATRASPPRHAHAQCSSCGAVVDVPEQWLGDVAARLDDELGFALDAAHAALLGTCQRCARS